MSAENVRIHDDGSITIDGKALAPPADRARYAEETRILVRDTERRNALLAWMRGQCGDR